MATDIAKVYVQVIPSAEGMSQNLTQIMSGEAAKAGTSSGKSFGASFGGAVGTGLKVAGGAAVAAASGMATLGASLVSNAKETAAMGDNVDKLSQKIGISAEAFQEWDYVFSQNGADIGILEGGMKKLSSTVADAANGNKTAAAQFEQLGLSVKDLSGLSQEDIFGKVIEQLQQMPESAERTALASDLLGRSAMELGPLLNQTAADTQALKDQAHDLGLIMSDEAVKNSAAFTDAMDNLSRAMDGAKNSIMADLLPSLTEITNGFANLVAGNEGATEQLTSGFASLGQSITAAIPSIMAGMTSIIDAIASVAPDMISTLGSALMSALPQIAGTLGNLIPQLVQTLTGMLPQLMQVGLQIIAELVKGIAEALPELIPSTIEIIMQLVQGLIENIPMLVDAAIQLLMGLAEGLLEAIPVLIEAIPDIIKGLIDALIAAIPQLIDGAIKLVTMLAEHLPEIIQALVEAIPEIVTAIVDALPQMIPALIDGAIQLVVAIAEALPQIIMALIEAIPAIIDSIVQAFMALGPALQQTFTQVVSSLSAVFAPLAQWAADAWRSIQAAFNAVGTWFKQKFTEAVNAIRNAFAPIKQFFSQIWDEIVAVFSNALDKFGEIGRNIVEGIKNGIAGSWEKFKDWLSGLFGDIVGLAKKILGIESPSKVMAAEVGQWIPAGIAQGIRNGMGVLNDEIQRMTNDTLVGTITTSTEAINSVNYMPNASAVVTEDTRALNLLAEYLPIIAEGMNTTVEIKQNDQGVFNAVRSANNRMKISTGYHALA